MEITLNKENVDGVKKLWLPDSKVCAEQAMQREIEEWNRKNGKGTRRPSEMGIEMYRYGSHLPSKFFEGRTPPPVPLDSAENLEWYAEQLHRCIYGFEYKGTRITGDHYWFLNFTPFLIAIKDKKGNVTSNFDVAFPYFAWMQDYIFKVIEEAHLTGKGFMLMGGRGFGKQQPDSEAVMTPNGPVPMGTLRPGDYVLGSDGQPTKVLQIHPQGIDDVYELTLKDGRSIRCGLEHLWDVTTTNGEHKTLELKDMLSTYKKEYENGEIYYQYYIQTAGPAEYPEQQLPINPYTLGALLGDGSFDKYGVRLGTASDDTEILDHILDIEGWDYDKHVSIYKRKFSKKRYKSFIRVFFKKETGLLENIKKLNLYKVKTFEKYIPKQYMYSSIDQRMELLRGLMDTDGSISKKGRIEFYTKSKQLADDVLLLVRSLGIKASMGLDDRGKKIGYRIRLYTGQRVFNLIRKVKRLNTNPNNRIKLHRERTAIIGIKKLDYKEQSTCITVDAKDNLYLTTDYTVTHNTYMILSILAKSYYLKHKSHNIVSASHSGHAGEAFSKMKEMLNAIDKVHPTIALSRLVDTKFMVKSGYEITKDGKKFEEGPLSRLNQVIYGDNPGVTRGSRPDVQLMEECLAPGTKVLMQGYKYKEIQDIKIGDMVLDGALRPRRVMRTTNGMAKMFKITQEFGKPYYVNPEHKLSLYALDETLEMAVTRIRAKHFFEMSTEQRRDYFSNNIQHKKGWVDIEEDEVGEYYGFTLAGANEAEHEFVLSDGTITHNCGDWAAGKGNLKACIGASTGSWRVGGIRKTRVFLIGTGGSVSSHQAKDIFLSPGAYDIIAVEDFGSEVRKPHAVFIPSHYFMGGMDWERTTVNNNEKARAFLEAERERTQEDMEIHDKLVQEYPFTVSEVFRQSGTNIFNQRNIIKQIADINFNKEHVVKPERGLLEWKRSKSGRVIGVEWALNPKGNIEIVEHPYRGKDGKSEYPGLYVLGVDSIDQGQLDSTSTKHRSSLACLVKKRIVDGEYFSQTSNLYVAKYIGRSLDVRDDYEEVLKLSMYYEGMVNIEYTKIGIVQYFREKKQWHRFMKRPMVARATAGAGELPEIIKMRQQNQIGTTATPHVIDHQDGKIKEYTQDACHQIFFIDQLEQLRDYQRENRTEYDLVIAMGLCEIADEDMMGEAAKQQGSMTEEFTEFGYYTDERGIKRFGSIPSSKRKQNIMASMTDGIKYGFRWIDASGNIRYDDKYDITDIHDLDDS